MSKKPDDAPQPHSAPLILRSQISTPRYRPDIDGLRAIAVLAVVAFHAFPEWVKGGFLGVDIFFVISGYLISTIIFENLDRGTFSFIEFYIRRIKRIFPALLVVLIACYVFGWFSLLANEYEQLGKHIAAVACFVANITLWSEAGYFAPASETKPLLHLWSLGVEEQFYLFWPPLLWLAWKQRFNLLALTALIFVISLYLNLREINVDDTAAFFSPQTRFWELSCGSLLAWAVLYKKDISLFFRIKIDKWSPTCSHFWGQPVYVREITSHALSLIGLFLITYSFWIVDVHTSFLGKLAIVPVLGATLIILAGPAAWANRIILSNYIAVWIGLISFPIYLWHWPLLSFARIIEGHPPSDMIRIAMVIFSIVLSWGTYRLIERPIRHKEYSRRKAITLILLMMTVGGIGYGTYLEQGLGFRFPKIIQDLTQYKYDYANGYREGSCFLRPEQNYRDFSKCPTETSAKRKSILLWGDSHAAHLYPGYDLIYGKDFEIIQRTASGCPPLLNIEIADRAHCREINDKTFSLVQEKHPDKVVLSAIWSSYDLNELSNTITQLRKAGVTNIDLVGPVPKWENNLPDLLALYFNKSIPHVIPYRMKFGLNPDFIELDQRLKLEAYQLGIRYISPKDVLCNIDGCITRLGETGDTLTSWDSGHLTSAGSEFLVAGFPKI